MRIVNKLDLDNPRSVSEHGSWAIAKNVQISENGTHTEVEDKLIVDEYPQLEDKIILGFVEVPDELIVFAFDYTTSVLDVYRHKPKSSELNRALSIKDARYKDKRIHGAYTYNNKGHLIITFGTIEFEDSPEILLVNLEEVDTSRPYVAGSVSYNTLLLHPNYFEKLPRIELDSIGAGSLDTGAYFLAMCYEDDNRNQSPFTSLSRPIILSNCLEQDYAATQGDVAVGSLTFDFVQFHAWRGTEPPYYDFGHTGSWYGTFSIFKGDVHCGTLMLAPITNWDDVQPIIQDFNNTGQGIELIEGSGEFLKAELDTSIEANVKKVKGITFTSTGGDGKYTIYVWHKQLTSPGVQPGTFRILHKGEEVIPHEGNTPPSYSSSGDISVPKLKTNKILPSGKPSGKSLNIKLNNLSSSYSKVRLAVLYYSNRTLAHIKLTNVIEYTGNSLSYNVASISTLQDTALENIIVDNVKYIRAKSIVNNANKLLLYNLELPEAYFKKFQEVTNNATIQYHVGRIDGRDDRVYYGNNINTFADTKNIYYFRSFKKGEVYCFYIGYKSKKGGWLSVNHLPNITGTKASNPLSIHTTDNRYPTSIPGIGGTTMAFHRMPENIDTIYSDHPKGQYLGLVGIEIGNVVIPEELKEHCAGWEVFYAERTAENITRLGQGFMPIHKGEPLIDKEIKSFVSFDLFYFKYPTSLIKELIRIYEIDPNSFDEGNAFYNNADYKQATFDRVSIPEFEYKSGIDTDKPDRTTLVLNTPGIYEIVVNNNLKNLYSSIFNQTLVSTGIIRDADETTSGKEFGGDVYISRYAHRFTSDKILHNMAPDLDDDHPINRSEVHQAILESSFNYELRHEGDVLVEPEDGEWSEEINAFQLIFPQSPSGDVNRMPLRKGNYINDDFGNSYDQTYSLINNIENPLVDIDDNSDIIFKTRIAISDPNISDYSLLGWRIFRPNNYYDIPANRGEGVKLVSADKNLYIQNQYGLFIAQIKDILELANNTQVWLGSGDLFDRPSQEILYDKSGGIGCRDYYSAISTKFGYMVCDRDKAAIYQIGQDVKDLTNENFKTWFKHNTNVMQDDIIHIGFDEDRKRVIITRHNLFTISYSLLTNGLTAFHDYNPHYLPNTRTSIVPIINNKLHKFIDAPTNYKSFIDVNVNHEPHINKLFQSIIWKTEAILNGTLDYTKTIDKIMVYNDSQCTGLLDIEFPQEWHNKTKGAYISNAWFFNKLQDAVVDDRMPFLNNWLPNNNVQLNAIDWHKLSQIISTFITVRLQSDNTTNHRLKFIELLIEATNNNR